MSDDGRHTGSHQRRGHPLILNSMLCVALAVYFEARNQPPQGQIAVAYVVLNRVADPRYPSDPCAVVMEGPTYAHSPSNMPVRHRCQFSFFCDGRPEDVRDMTAWREARMWSELAIRNAVDDVTKGSTHYHTTAVWPFWAPYLTQTVVIEDHIFYRNPDAPVRPPVFVSGR